MVISLKKRIPRRHQKVGGGSKKRGGLRKAEIHAAKLFWRRSTE